MGVYKDGKWVPTWGDDQFGVVDSPSYQATERQRTKEFIDMMEKRIMELEAENKELRRLTAHYRRGLDMIRHERSVELSNRAVLDTVYCIAVRFLLEGNTDEIRKKRD